MMKRSFNPPVLLWIWVLFALLASVPSWVAWNRDPLIVTRHEFDFFIGWPGSGGLSPDGWVFAGCILHTLLFSVMNWCFWKLICELEKGVAWTAAQVAGPVVLIIGSMATLLPWLSPDVFFYLGTGWVHGMHGIDVYSQPIDAAPDYPDHPIYANIWDAWHHITTPYGPLFVHFASWVTWLGNGNERACLLILKAVFLCLHVVNAAMAAAIGGHLGMQRKAVWMCFLLNPALLFCHVGRLHNDILMLSFILGALWLLLEKREVLAMVLLGLAAGLKYVPVLLAPALLVFLLRGDWRVGNLLRVGMLAVVFLAAVLLPSLTIGSAETNFLRLFVGRDQLCMNFLYAVIGTFVEMAGWMSYDSFKLVMKILFLLIYAAMCFRFLWRGRDITFQDLCSLWLVVLLVYFVIGSPEIHEWYYAWFASFVFWVNRLDCFKAAIQIGTVVPALAVWTGPRFPVLSVVALVLIFGLLWMILRHLTRINAHTDMRPSPLFRPSAPVCVGPVIFAGGNKTRP